MHIAFNNVTTAQIVRWLQETGYETSAREAADLINHPEWLMYMPTDPQHPRWVLAMVIEPDGLDNGDRVYNVITLHASITGHALVLDYGAHPLGENLSEDEVNAFLAGMQAMQKLEAERVNG